MMCVLKVKLEIFIIILHTLVKKMDFKSMHMHLENGLVYNNNKIIFLPHNNNVKFKIIIL